MVTVSELIGRLSQFPPHAEVRIMVGDGDDQSVGEITLERTVGGDLFALIGTE